MKTGLVVEGGGMKCAYSAGILDKLLDDDIHFDFCVGVSAGAANTLSYLAGQRGRNLRFYTEHLGDPRYLSIRSLLRTGNLFGLQYIYGTLTNSDGKDPIYKHMLRKYPKTVEGIDHRHLNYQASIDLAAQLEKKGDALIFAPSRHLKLGTFSKDPVLEQQLYDLGTTDYNTKAFQLKEFLRS